MNLQSDFGDFVSGSAVGTFLALLAYGILIFVLYLVFKSTILLTRGVFKVTRQDFDDPKNNTLLRWVFWSALILILLCLAYLNE